MSSKRSVAGEAARRACIDFPEATTRTLASKLWTEERALFTSYEQCRAMIRDYRGEHGEKRRARRASALVPTTKHETTLAKAIPKSDAKPLPPMKFDGRGRGAIISDLHIPYHDKQAILTTLEHIQQEKATDFLIINGDLVDCYALSTHVKDPRRRDFKGELGMTNQFLGAIRPKFGKVWLKEGNHEDRFGRYLRIKAPELLGLGGFNWPTFLRLEERDITWVPSPVTMQAGALSIIHGHEFGRGGASNPVNPARGLFLRAKDCALWGHFHRTSHHTEGTIRDSRIACWSLGCLCDLRPEYDPMAFTRWNHGFAIMEFDGKGFEIQNHMIVEGKVR